MKDSFQNCHKMNRSTVFWDNSDNFVTPNAEL